MEMKTWRAYMIVDKELRRRLIDTTSDEYADALDKIVSLEPGPQTRMTLGLVPPAPTTDQLFHHSSRDTVLLMARISERILPRAVVVDEVAKRGARLLRQEGNDRKQLNRKEFAQLKDEVIAQLLPKSHIKHKLIPVLIRGQYLVVGASSTKVCEDILNRLRFAFGTLKVIPFQTKTPAIDIMRRMLDGVLEQDELADLELRLGSRAKLDHKEGSQVTVKGEDLRGEHVTTLIDDDYYPIEVSMTGCRNDVPAIKFVVNKAWVFKSFKSTIEPEDVIDQHSNFEDDQDAEWQASMARFDANLILLADSVFSTVDTMIDAAGALEPKEVEIAVRDMWGSLNKAGERESKQTYTEDGRRGDTPVWIHDTLENDVWLGTVADLDAEGMEEIVDGYEAACRLRVEYGLPEIDKNGNVLKEDEDGDLDIDEDLDDL